MASEVSVTPSCIAEMKCGGSAVIRSTCARAAVALALELADPRAPRRDEAVLGRHEERVQQDQPGEGEKLEREGHLPRAAAAGAQVLGGTSSSKRPGIVASAAARRLRDTNICSMLAPMRAEYREEPCKVALNRVKGMPFAWSLNPYMGCAHRCTFCYVRAFELRADRPADARYGTSIRVKVNVAEVLRRELARPLVDGERDRDRRRDRPVPAGRGPLPADAGVPRGARRRREPVLADHARPADRARRRRARRGGDARGRLGHVLGADARRARSGAAPSRARRRRTSGCARSRGSSTRACSASVGMAPILPGHLGPARSSSRRSCAPRARPAHAASGRTSCT